MSQFLKICVVMEPRYLHVPYLSSITVSNTFTRLSLGTYHLIVGIVRYLIQFNNRDSLRPGRYLPTYLGKYKKSTTKARPVHSLLPPRPIIALISSPPIFLHGFRLLPLVTRQK